MSCSTLAPPFLIQYPHSKVESIEKNPVTLTCRARGNPRPVIEWSKEGLPLNLDPHFEIMPSGDLYIREVRMVDHGTYRCRATNRAGGVAASTRLIVTGNFTQDFLDSVSLKIWPILFVSLSFFNCNDPCLFSALVSSLVFF